MSEAMVYMEGGVQPYGGFWRRLMAAIIDNILMMIPIMLILNMAGLSFADFVGLDIIAMGQDPSGAEFLIKSGFIATALYLFYKIIFEASSLRATPGKLVMGIRVTDTKGETLTLFAATLRSWPWWLPNALIILDVFAGTGSVASTTLGFGAIISFLVAAFTAQKQGVHDMMSGALVVKKGAQFEAMRFAA